MSCKQLLPSKLNCSHFMPCNFFSNTASTSLSQCQSPFVNVNITINGAPSTINESQIIQALPANIVVQSYQDVVVVSESVWSQGYYCLADSTAMTPCPPGTYNNLTNGNSAAFCLTCPSRAYCPQASPLPVSCGAGYYNSLTGQGSIAACWVCPS